MCGTENELSNMLTSFYGEGDVVLFADVVNSLTQMLYTHNEYVRTFRIAKEVVESMNLDSYGVRIFARSGPRRTIVGDLLKSLNSYMVKLLMGGERSL